LAFSPEPAPSQEKDFKVGEPKLKQVEAKPKHAGKPVTLGGREYIIPSLSVNQAQELWPDLMAAERDVTVENLPQKWAQMLPIVAAAIKRNYPEMTVEEIGDLVGLDQLPEVVLIVVGQSGLRAAPGGAAPAAGNRVQ
jgi:hypothetical protein